MLPILKSTDLLLAWTKRSIRARYQQSILGWLWAIVQPIASVIIFSIVFTNFIRVDTGSIPYPIFSFVALAPWTFFSSSLADMTQSLVQNIYLVTRIYFPREILPLAAMLARFLDFLVALGVMAAMLVIYKVDVYPPALLFIPLIILIQMILILGIGLLTSALYVYYRDVNPLMILITQLWFYASPVIYPISTIPEKYRFLYFLNPMSGILEGYRTAIFYRSIPDYTLLIAGLEAVAVLVFGYWLFKRLEFQFADVV